MFLAFFSARDAAGRFEPLSMWCRRRVSDLQNTPELRYNPAAPPE